MRYVYGHMDRPLHARASLTHFVVGQLMTRVVSLVTSSRRSVLIARPIEVFCQTTKL